MSRQDAINDPQNGMIDADIDACLRVAKARNEVITFRSTGPWAKRWINAQCPTKGFHVKGKSSDWGPQAGFVPYLGEYSKVGADSTAAVKGTKANDEGITDKAAKAIPLMLTEEELRIQATVPAEGRTALTSLTRLSNGSFTMQARRSGDGSVFDFTATKSAKTRNGKPLYTINTILDARIVSRGKIPVDGEMLVMTTTEDMGAFGERPMTGDYDLMTICPSFGSYGSALPKSVGHGNERNIFTAGQNLDRVMDQRLATRGGSKDYYARMNDYQKKARELAKSGPSKRLDALKKQIDILVDGASALDKEAIRRGNHRNADFGATWLEHKDMGNMTPRTLMCINDLNIAMGAFGPSHVLRRVHHNTEADRPVFFAETGKKMREENATFPITVFQPRAFGGYHEIHVIKEITGLQTYFNAVFAAGYFVPKNLNWSLSGHVHKMVQQLGG